MASVSNPRFPHTCRITRIGKTDPMVDDAEVTLLYEGECRAYDKFTTSGTGDVITSNRGLSLPVTREGWIERGVNIHEGDIIVVDRGGYEEHGYVLDKNPGNFGGTHLIWKFDRN